MACEHCHNHESWAIDDGKDYTVGQEMRTIKKPGPKKKTIRGVTFSGGEPFLQAKEIAKVAAEVRKLGWDVVTYTGYTYEELCARNDPDVHTLLHLSDYLIDGRYIHERRNRSLVFRGSDNQRIIDMAATRNQGHVVLADLVPEGDGNSQIL